MVDLIKFTLEKHTQKKSENGLKYHLVS